MSLKVVASILWGSALLLTACSSVASRKQAQPEAYSSLDPAVRHLVDQGRIQRGMDTNAVYLAWGPPSDVVRSGGVGHERSTWLYFGNRAVVFPTWRYMPDPRGYWTLEPTTAHYSAKYTAGEVEFENGRVIEWKRF